jgi:hypothetical protein
MQSCGCPSDSWQEDFECLEMDYLPSKETSLLSANIPSDLPDLKSVSSVVDRLIPRITPDVVSVGLSRDASIDDCMDLNLSNHSPSRMDMEDCQPVILQASTSCTLSDVSMHTPSDIMSPEPTRMMRPSSTFRRPKRFSRTFWRGITARALAADRQDKSAPE